MKFATIGTNFLDDIIIYGKETLKKEITNVGRYTCINPISLIFNKEFPKEIYEKYDLDCENAYQKKMYISDIRKTVLKEIKEAQPDYIMIDLAEIFLPIKIYKENDQEIVYTSHNYLNSANYGAEKEQVLSISNLPKNVVFEYVQKFMNLLIHEFDAKSIILVKTFYPYQYFDKEGQWKLALNLSDLISRNDLLSDVYKLLDANYKLKTICMPELIFNDLSYNTSGTYKLAECFYKYASAHLDGTIANEPLDIINETLFSEREQFIDKKISNLLLTNVLANGIKKGKKLVLIGQSSIIEEGIKEKFNVKIDEKIEYDRNISEKKLESEIGAYRNKSKEYYFIIPHVYRDTNLIQIITKNGFFPNAKKVAMAYYRYQIRDIKGLFFDIFNNKIESHYGKNVFKIMGKGANLFVGESNQCGQLSIDLYDQSKIMMEDKVGIVGASFIICCYWGATLRIGGKTTFGSENRLMVYSGGEMVIGEDCMFADRIVAQVGDGHSIYDLKSNENINSDLNKFQQKLKLVVGAHVWVGRGATLINCDIGRGSIVGAGALVKKKHPNNCIIAGIPARVIRKDIAWSREINCYDIDDEIFGVPKDYQNFTQED
ncbi:MAG: hypothetical protein IJ735_07910 [Clostridia bacterium]|nr:hypothetical protein [Clostridia bacterium]